MKILLVHNFYGSSAPSGENAVFLIEAGLLRRKGHEVIEFTRHSDGIRKQGFAGMVKGGLSAAWNPFAVKKLRHVLERERPDIMHVHNTFPLLSPAVFHAARDFPTATVLTLHNYRTFCAAGIAMRDDLPCTRCMDEKSVLPALKYGCYRGSRLATIPLAAMIWLHREIGTWQRDLDAFIALTEFQKEKLVNAGLPDKSFHIKPHFYPNPPMPLPWERRDGKVIYIGRLEACKGVHTLINAWKRWDGAPVLEIIGDGPEKEPLQHMAERYVGDRIVFTGYLPFHETQNRLARSNLLVLPSLCFEGFPMVLREAFALGVPVAASRIGSIPYMVADGTTGTLFQPGNAADLSHKVRDIWTSRNKLKEMAGAARDEFDRKYTADSNFEMLMGIYHDSIKARKKRMNTFPPV